MEITGGYACTRAKIPEVYSQPEHRLDRGKVIAAELNSGKLFANIAGIRSYVAVNLRGMRRLIARIRSSPLENNRKKINTAVHAIAVFDGLKIASYVKITTPLCISFCITIKKKV